MTQIIGQVSSSGEVEIGRHSFNSSRVREGVYEIEFIGTPFNREPVVVVTSLVDGEDEASGVGLYNATAEGFTVNIKTMHEDPVDRGFNFTAEDAVREYAVYTEFSPVTKPLEKGLNSRVFTEAEVQSGESISLDLNTGIVYLQAGLYHITASSIVTYFKEQDAEDGKVTTLERPNGGYCILQDKTDGSTLATGTISHANMLASTIDTYLEVDTTLKIGLEHQAGTDVDGLYLQVYVEESENHVFARMSIRRL